MRHEKRHKAEPSANYLLFSDVHLGADLVQHARPWTVNLLKRAARIDRYLVSMLEHYRDRADAGRPWKLVIAGDLVDFIGMSIAPSDDDNEEEHAHGLGSTEKHAALKMRAVAERHRAVFKAFAEFVRAGHSLILIRGNHDIDFHWSTAQQVFIDSVLQHIEEDERTKDFYASRIEFYPWFYYVKGLLYVEHGHQYDELCSYASQLMPVRPDDPRRTNWSLSDVLLRFIVRPTAWMSSEGHENQGVMDYIRKAFRSGRKETYLVFRRYVRAIAHALRVWRASSTIETRWLFEEHDRRMRTFARQMRVNVAKVRRLALMAARPAHEKVSTIVRTLFIERVFLGLLALLSFSLMSFSNTTWGWWLATVALFIVLNVAAHLWSKRLRVLDASSVLKQAAAQIASIFPAKFIVMGHTHQPTVERVHKSTLYVNLGNWGTDDLDATEDTPHRAPCTHLVIRHVDGKPQAAFYAWDIQSGLREMPLPALRAFRGLSLLPKKKP